MENDWRNLDEAAREAVNYPKPGGAYGGDQAHGFHVQSATKDLPFDTLDTSEPASYIGVGKVLLFYANQVIRLEAENAEQAEALVLARREIIRLKEEAAPLKDFNKSKWAQDAINKIDFLEKQNDLFREKIIAAKSALS